MERPHHISLRTGVGTMRQQADSHTFHARKRARTDYYNKYTKGWRLQDCMACNGTGVYDHHNSPACSSCAGTGKERAKPNCVTDIEPLIKQTLRLEVAPSVDLHIYIRNKREVIHQFIGVDDGTKDPRFRAKLQFGYDILEHAEDWFFEDELGGKFYLHQFESIPTK